MKRGVSILVTIVIVVICTVVRCNKKLDRIERDSKQRREQVRKEVNVSYTIDEEDLNRYQQKFLEKQFQKYKEQNEKNQKLVEQLNKYR